MITAGRTAFIAAAALAAAALSGCSAHLTRTTVDMHKIERSTADQIYNQLGYHVDSIHCPHPLQHRVGSTQMCSMVTEGATYGVTLTVTGTSWTDVQWNWRIDGYLTSI